MSTVVTVEKRKFPRASALAVVRELLAELKPACEKIVVAGSLRRRKEAVGDIEFVYIPRMVQVADPEDFFGKKITVNAVDQLLARWIAEGTIGRRLSKLGRTMWGPQNKFAVHCASEIPVDFFATDHARFYNMLVCRTGGAATNVAICEGAQKWGWKWEPYDEGFVRKPSSAGPEYHDVRVVHSERDVFSFAGLPYLEPWERA
jgi:DNA polymerase/3'-5' exonuclease PolX